jgi:hypothetical protein
MFLLVLLLLVSSALFVLGTMFVFAGLCVLYWDGGDWSWLVPTGLGALFYWVAAEAFPFVITVAPA